MTAPRSRRGRRLPLLLVAALALAGCGSSGTAAPPPPSPDASPEAAGDLPVRPGDVLLITVWPSTELSGEYQVEETGLAHLPGIGAVEVGGRPLREVRADLRARYGEALRSPVVTITPRFLVSVLGAVNAPGLYPVEPSMSLFDVISLAGWFRDDARRDDVRILRQGETIEFDAESALRRGGGGLAEGLRSGDRIIVPERWFRLGEMRDVIILGNFVGLLIGLGTRIF